MRLFKRIAQRLLPAAVMVLIIVGAAWAVTESHTEGSGSPRKAATKLRVATVSYVTADFPNDNAVTETLDSIYGIVMRITVDVTGGTLDVLLRDESDITIFTKTGIAADVGYAIYEDDTEGNPWAGVFVGGAMDLLVTNADEETALTVKIYYIDFWR